MSLLSTAVMGTVFCFRYLIVIMSFFLELIDLILIKMEIVIDLKNEEEL